jgi:hypothetical protein
MVNGALSSRVNICTKPPPIINNKEFERHKHSLQDETRNMEHSKLNTIVDSAAT